MPKPALPYHGFGSPHIRVNQTHKKSNVNVLDSFLGYLKDTNLRRKLETEKQSLLANKNKKNFLKFTEQEGFGKIRLG